MSAFDPSGHSADAAMNLLRAICTLVALPATAAALGLACSTAWLTQSDLVAKIALGTGCLLFMLWPIGGLFLAGPQALRLRGFAIMSLGTLLAPPAFVSALAYFVRTLAGFDVNREVLAVAYPGGYTCAALGIGTLFWRLRFGLFSNS